MAIKIRERWDSGQGDESEDSGSREIIKVVAGAPDEATAVNAALAETALAITQPSGRVLVFQSYGWEIADGDLVHVTIKYGTQKPPELGSYDFTFDTGGQMQKITQSLQTVGKYAPAGETAPDNEGAIGFDGDTVEGTEILVPQFTWTETHYPPLSAITWTYADVLEALTGKVNSAPFRGRAAGTVRFDGAQGGKKDEQKGQLSYKFTRSPNATNLTVGSITGIAKEGWQYLWVRYKSAESQNRPIKKPAGVYVEKVYEAADFSALGIGP